MTIHSKIARALAEGWRPPSDDPIEVWMEKNVPLDRTSSISGKWRLAVTPWALQPLRDFANPFVRDITTVGPSQGAKSTPSINAIAWAVVNEPGPTLYITADKEKARETSKERLGVILPAAAGQLYTDDRHDATTFSIRLTTCTIDIRSAQAENSLESNPRKYVFASECRKWDPGLLAKIEKRTRTYPNCKRWKESTPGIFEDEFHQSYLQSNQQEWFFRCMNSECGQEIHLSPPKTWETLMHWDKNETTCPAGKWDKSAVAKNIRLECPYCKHPHHDTTEVRRHIAAGWFKPLNPSASVENAGQRWNALLPTWIKWVDLWEEFYKAQEQANLGYLKPLEIFITESMAEWWNDKEDRWSTAEVEIKTAEWSAADVPIDWGDHTPMTVDVQDKSFWVVIRGWMKQGAESRAKYAAELMTWGDVRDYQLKYKIRDKLVFVDSGDGKHAREIYRRCCQFGWTALKGEGYPRSSYSHHVKVKGVIKTVRRIYSELQLQDPGIGTVDQGKKRCAFFLFASDAASDILENLIQGRGASWGVPKDFDREYWFQLSGEIKKDVFDKKTGRKRPMWVKIRRNHIRDCEKMQVIAAAMLGVIGAPVEEQKAE